MAARSERRQFMALLKKSLDGKWQVEPSMILHALGVLKDVLDDPESSTRDRVRAAEAVLNVQAHAEDRLIRAAALEERLLETDEQCEEKAAWNSVFPTVTEMIRQENEQKAARRERG